MSDAMSTAREQFIEAGYARAIADVAAWLRTPMDDEPMESRNECRDELADALDSGAWKEQQ